MASFLSFLLGEKKKTASVAKERLQIILAHERSGRGASRPDYLPALHALTTALVLTLPKVDAGLAASIFHFGEVSIPDLKRAKKIMQRHSLIL